MSKLTDRAKELENSRNLEGALNYYEIAVEEKSCPFDVRSDIGRVLNRQEKYDQSEKCFDLVLSMDENHEDSWFGLGISYLGNGKWRDSLEAFKKALNLNKENANYYYYIAVILKHFNDERAEEYYQKFLELDTDNFKRIRNFYKFGLYFDDALLELGNSNKRVNLSGYNKLLRYYGLDNDDIIFYLRTKHYPDLMDFINELNEKKFEDDEKRVIYEELSKLGLSKSDIDDMLVLDSRENIKNEVLSACKEDPFPKKTNPPKITHFIDSNDEHSDEKPNQFTPVNFASRFNFICKLNLDDSKNTNFLIDKFKRNPIINRKKAKIHKNNLKLLNLAIKYIKNEEYDLALDILDLINDDDLSIHLNVYFIKGSLFAFKDLKKAWDCFVELENSFPDIDYLPEYIFNKGNLLYDVGELNQAIECYKYLPYPRAKYLEASAYYKLGDTDNANKIFEEYLNM